MPVPDEVSPSRVFRHHCYSQEYTLEKLQKVKKSITSGDKLNAERSLHVKRPIKPLPGQMSLTMADGTPLAGTPSQSKRARHD
jgi:hypothetical protein